MAALEVPNPPVTLMRGLVAATDAAQTLSALHTIEQNIEHGKRRFAQSDHKDSLVVGQVDGGRADAVGQKPSEL